MKICTRQEISLGFNIIISLLFFITWIDSLNGQVWWEETGKKYDYDLSNNRILILLGDDFDYYETIIIKNFWENWGAKVEIAGVDTVLSGHLWKKTKIGWDRSEQRQIKADLSLSQVRLSRYQVIFFPGGNSPKSLLEKDSLRVVKMIQKANQKKLLIAGICHGPQILAAAGIIRGRKVTGHPDVVKDFEMAGGEYTAEVCVVDGNIITGNWPYFETMAVKVAEKLLYPNSGD